MTTYTAFRTSSLQSTLASEVIYSSQYTYSIPSASLLQQHRRAHRSRNSKQARDGHRVRPRRSSAGTVGPVSPVRATSTSRDGRVVTCGRYGGERGGGHGRDDIGVVAVSVVALVVRVCGARGWRGRGGGGRRSGRGGDGWVVWDLFDRVRVDGACATGDISWMNPEWRAGRHRWGREKKDSLLG